MSGNSILSVFAKSPFKPIEEHICEVTKAAQKLIPFFDAVFAKDWEQAEAIRCEISELERTADKQKQDIRIHLPKGLFLPIDRSDLIELLNHQDKIANKAKDIAGRIVGREMDIPASLQQDFKTYLQRCIEAVEQASRAINELDELIETGFRGREAVLVEKLITEVSKVEEDTDKLQRKIRKELHKIENSINPIDAIFLYGVFEWIGGLADSAEAVCGRLELLLAK
ncbi:TIGR00153 family protein [Saccharobesus litoralis]|uniref:TIGR00153 family protein n=1 Tax=Saccharobesus litoralis TaxID=2172099 RepID=A0A2S0VMQ9_9ALTE|nr:TIGR00153 family protein [Saccharobesus litoralis]AWB65511.1 TIGR00153 family protein [Saccharobesus litoralis]